MQDIKNLCHIVENYSNAPEQLGLRTKCCAHIKEHNYMLEECDKEIVRSFYGILFNYDLLGRSYTGYNAFHTIYIPARDKIKKYLGITGDIDLNRIETWEYDEKEVDKDVLNLCIVLVNTDNEQTEFKKVQYNKDARTPEYFEARNKCIKHLMENNFVLNKCDKNILQTFHDDVVYAEFIDENNVLAQVLDCDEFDYVYAPGRDELKYHLEIPFDNNVYQITAEDLRNMTDEQRLNIFTQMIGEKKGQELNDTVNSLLPK